ncbi:MAG: four helix bundle protein [Deltaproteobacteria bacterium]|nr:four helix bundle protein [Deltaproteobacteria bacterium]
MQNKFDKICSSIMANIAEGFDGGSNREFTKFPVYSIRSASEVQSHL